MNQESDTMTLDERLERVGALLAIGAIRAATKQVAEVHSVEEEPDDREEKAG